MTDPRWQTWIAGTLLALILLAGVAIVVLLLIDRLPLSKQPPEPTPLQRQMNELAEAFNEVERTVGMAMLPVMQKTTDAINRLGGKL